MQKFVFTRSISVSNLFASATVLSALNHLAFSCEFLFFCNLEKLAWYYWYLFSSA